jgi:hypothetical protein
MKYLGKKKRHWVVKYISYCVASTSRAPNLVMGESRWNRLPPPQNGCVRLEHKMAARTQSLRLLSTPGASYFITRITSHFRNYTILHVTRSCKHNYTHQNLSESSFVYSASCYICHLPRRRWVDKIRSLCGLVVRVPGYRTEMYCVCCEVRTEFIYVM